MHVTNKQFLDKVNDSKKKIKKMANWFIKNFHIPRQ